MPLGTEFNHSPGDVVLDGVAAPPKRGTAPQFSVYCGQTAGWMKTPLGTEVDLGPCHIVLHGDPAHPAKGAQYPPLSGPCLLWPRSPILATAEPLSILCFALLCHCQCQCQSRTYAAHSCIASNGRQVHAEIILKFCI